MHDSVQAELWATQGCGPSDRGVQLSRMPREPSTLLPYYSVGKPEYSSSPGRARKDFLATDTQVPRAQQEHTWHWVLPHQGVLFQPNSASQLGCAPMVGMLTQHRRPQLQGHRLILQGFSDQAELGILAQHPGHSKDSTGETSIRKHRARTFSVTRSKVTVP